MPEMTLMSPDQRALSSEHVQLTADDAQRLGSTIDAALSEKTRSTYASQWRTYNSWLAQREYTDQFRADIVAAYLAWVAENRSPSSVDQARAAILFHAGQQDGSVAALLREHTGIRTTMRGTRRLARGRVVRQARALTKTEIRAMVSTLSHEDSIRAQHDRALLLLGLALGVRGSELVRIRLRDIAEVDGGLDVVIAFSKVSDEPQVIPVAEVHGLLCPVAAVRTWMETLARLGIDGEDDALFHPIRRGGMSVAREGLSAPSVTDVLIRIAQAAGVRTEGLRSHSLRSTYCTLALSAGFSERDVARGRWAEGSAMIHRYNRAEAWENPASGWLGA